MVRKEIVGLLEIESVIPVWSCIEKPEMARRAPEGELSDKFFSVTGFVSKPLWKTQKNS